MQRAESAPEKFEFRVELMSEFLWFVQFRWFSCITNFPVWANFSGDATRGSSVRTIWVPRGADVRISIGYEHERHVRDNKVAMDLLTRGASNPTSKRLGPTAGKRKGRETEERTSEARTLGNDPQGRQVCSEARDPEGMEAATQESREPAPAGLT